MAEQGAPPRLIIPALGGVWRALSPWSYTVIRFFAGLFLMPHGAQKLFGMFEGPGLAGTAAVFEGSLGLSPGMLWAALAGLIEFFGGLYVAIGFLTRPAALACVVHLGVIVFHVHLASGFFWTDGGYEFPLLWGAVMVAILFRGGGPHSIDAHIGREF